jgi:hypothetical protein
VSTRPVELSPALAAAVHRARAALEADGEPGRTSGYVSDFDDETRTVIARILSDGTYQRLADAVAADDPDVADL